MSGPPIEASESACSSEARMLQEAFGYSIALFGLVKNWFGDFVHINGASLRGMWAALAVRMRCGA